MLKRINDFLDRYILPWPVRYLSHRFIILATIGLLIPLVVYANNQVLVLMINSYLNTMSVAVSSIVLLYATISEIHQQQIAELQEKRAQEDHTHVTEMHQLTLQTLQNQKEEIDELKRIMAQVAGKELSLTASQAMPDLRDLHPRGDDRFADDDISRRLRDNLHHNVLVSTIRTNLQPDADDNPPTEDAK